MELTRDTNTILCLIYKEFLARRKDGMSKSEAKSFDCPASIQIQFMQGILTDDIHDALMELANVGFAKVYVTDDFMLTDKAIAFMENKFKKGLIEVTDFIAKFIP